MDPQEFLDPGAEYRGVTLWMLNDELELDEIARQLEGFRAAGWGAAITRTFVGLRTEYLSDAWMEVTAETIRLAGKLGMKVWLQAGYMPSGIPELAPEMAHRVLVRRAKGEPIEAASSGQRRRPDVCDLAGDQAAEEAVFEDEAHTYRVRAQDSVLDLLSADAVRDYLEKAYERPWAGRFGEEFGGTVEAVWVDEPHFRPPLLPWGGKLPARFREKWGYDIAEHLPSLFSEAGDFRKVRHHYWRTVLEMFLEAYFEPVGRWCDEHKVKFSGHLMGEDTLNSQTAWTGAAMPCYEFMQLPGIDHLTMSLTWPSGKKFILPPKQCSSAAGQLGRREILLQGPPPTVGPVRKGFGRPPRSASVKTEMACAVLAEMYGVSSQAITFEDRKQIGDWLALLGINYRCYHGSFYSMRGRRKRIYVPHLSHQQPWWPDNRLVADYFARLSYALRQGGYLADVLVIHPVESAYCLYDPASMERPHDRTREPEDVRALDDCLVRLSENLLRIHRGFEYGDETIMAKHARVTEGGLPPATLRSSPLRSTSKINVGRMVYKAVVLPSMITVRRTTLELLKQFAESGGTILSVGELPSRVDGIPEATVDELREISRPVENDPAALRRALDDFLPPEIELTPSGEGGPQGVESVWIHARRLDGARVYFLANTSRDEAVEAELRIPGSGTLEYWDLVTGEVKAAPQRREDGYVVTRLSFAPLASHLLVLKEGEAGAEVLEEWRKVSRTHRVFENARIRRHSPNALTLDCCRFRAVGSKTLSARRGKAGGEWSETLPVICVQRMLEREDYQGPVTLQFRFTVETRPKSISVVIEDAREYAIRVNGQAVEYSGSSWYLDRSFHPVEVTAEVCEGENTIEISRDFRPVPKSSSDLASLFETSLGVELESVYLIGDFAVRGTPFQVDTHKIEKPNCARYRPEFVLTEEKKTSGGDLLADGYPFFAGRMSLVDTVELSAPRDGERIVLALAELGAALAKVRVNGREAGAILWPPYELDVTSLVREGANEIDVEFVSTLRNLLGPHHRPSGEPDRCWGEPDFAFRPEWLERPREREANWTDDYFFVPFGTSAGAEIKRMHPRSGGSG